MFSIVVLSFCITNSLAELFYHDAPSIEWPFLPHVPIARAAIPIETKTQYHYQNGFGTVAYGYSEPTSSHHATHDVFGNKAGEFSYVKPDGTTHKTRYIADSEGYRVLSNDLPVGPAVTPLIHSLRKRSAAYAPVITPSGHIADTPEVAAAKAAHFLEHAKRGNYHNAAPAPYASWSVPVSPHEHHTTYSAWSTPVTHHQQRFGDSLASTTNPHSVAWPLPVDDSWSINDLVRSHPIVTSDGYLKDTPEVAQAKAAHFAEKLKVAKYNDYSYEATPSRYYSAVATAAASYALPHVASPYRAAYTSVTPEGQVTDTPEVAAAKVSHFAEHAAALARNAGDVDNHVLPVTQQYYAPVTYGGSSSVPADTPEVAQAKAAHFAEYARVAGRQKRSISYETYPASTLPLPHPAVSAVPAPLIVPHSTLSLPYSLPLTHLPKPITHFASSYQVVA